MNFGPRLLAVISGFPCHIFLTSVISICWAIRPYFFLFAKRTLESVSKEPVPEHPGVEVERVSVLRPEEVRMLEVLVRGHGQGRVAHALREHEFRTLVEGPRRRGLVAVHQCICAGAGVAEGRRADGVVGGQGALFGHQRLDGEAALSRRRKHHFLTEPEPDT